MSLGTERLPSQLQSIFTHCTDTTLRWLLQDRTHPLYMRSNILGKLSRCGKMEYSYPSLTIWTFDNVFRSSYVYSQLKNRVFQNRIGKTQCKVIKTQLTFCENEKQFEEQWDACYTADQGPLRFYTPEKCSVRTFFNVSQSVYVYSQLKQSISKQNRKKTV